jgi:mycothiol synthase
MSSSPPEATSRPVSLRAVSLADATACAELMRELEVSLGYPGAASPSELRDWWARADLDRDSWLFEQDGRPLAMAVLALHGDTADVGGGVRPDAAGTGLGSRLVALSEARARELDAIRVRSHGYEADAAGRDLLEARGYRPVRRFYEMAADLDGPPEEPVWPEGIRVEAFRPEDARAMHEALDEAFADEWGRVPMDFEQWRRLRVEEADTSLYFLARDGDQVAGVIRCEPEMRGMGWVGALGVRERWRRRGLGRALLLHALGAFHRRGQTRVGLDVDSENPHRASRLYERVGMVVQLAGVVYEKELS